MTETVLPKEALERLDPTHICPLVAYLAHDTCEENGSVFEIAGGYIAKLRWQRAEGHMFDLPHTVEDVKNNWKFVTDFSRENDYPTSTADTVMKVNENFERV